MTFPGAHSTIYTNEDGEVLGWDTPSEPDPNDYYNEWEDDMEEEEVECLEGDENCQGRVEYHYVGSATRAFPRCEYHIARRWERYENSMEKYADSDVAPSWFDESYAGERWDDD